MWRMTATASSGSQWWMNSEQVTTSDWQGSSAAMASARTVATATPASRARASATESACALASHSVHSIRSPSRAARCAMAIGPSPEPAATSITPSVRPSAFASRASARMPGHRSQWLRDQALSRASPASARSCSAAGSAGSSIRSSTRTRVRMGRRVAVRSRPPVREVDLILACADRPAAQRPARATTRPHASRKREAADASRVRRSGCSVSALGLRKASRRVRSVDPGQ